MLEYVIQPERKATLQFALHAAMLFVASLLPWPWLADMYVWAFDAVANAVLLLINSTSPVQLHFIPPADFTVAGTEASQGETGSASVAISALAAKDVAEATLTITAADISTPITAALANTDGSWKTTIGGIPAGSNRTFALSATDTAGAEKYRGQTTGITITANQTQEVAITLQQASASAAFSDAAPVIDLLQASSASVHPGATVNLSVSAHDPDPSDTLSYTWTSANGTLSSSSAPSTTWTAPATLGTYPVMVAVRDAQQETVTSLVQIFVTAAPPPVPIPGSTHWTLLGLLAAAGVVSLNIGKYKRAVVGVRR